MALIVTKMMMIALLLTTNIFISISNAVVSPVCQAASPDKALCSIATKDAPTWSAAMTNALNYELDYLNKAGKPIFDAIGSELPAGTDPKVKQDIIRTCNRFFQVVVRDLNSCFSDIARDPDSLPSAVGAQDLDCTLLIKISRVPVPSDLADFVKNFKRLNELLYGIALARRFVPPSSGRLGNE